MPGNRFDKKASYAGQISINQVRAGIRSAHANGLRLLNDARLLFRNRCYPSTVTLSLLSIEEFGKEMMLRAYAVRSQPEHVSFFWMQFRNHKSKAAVGALPELCRGSSIDEELAVMRAFDPNKMHGQMHNELKDVSIYVDIVERGQWQTPMGSIGKEFAEQALQRADFMAEATGATTSRYKLKFESGGRQSGNFDDDLT